MKRTRKFKLRSFGCLLAPTFRMSSALFFGLLFAIQVMTLIKLFEEDYSLTSSSTLKYYSDNSSGHGMNIIEVKDAFLVIYAFLLLTTILQFAIAWFDYQYFERWLLQSDSIVFGFIVGLLVLSDNTALVTGSSLWRFYYGLNCLLLVCLSFADVFDLRPLGAGKKLDLLQHTRDNLTSGNRLSEGESAFPVNGLVLRSPLRHAANRKYLTVGDTEEDASDLSGSQVMAIDLSADISTDADASDNVSDVEMGVRPNAAVGNPQPLSYESSPTCKTSSNHISSQPTIVSEDISEEFRVKLDRLACIAAQGNAPDAWSSPAAGNGGNVTCAATMLESVPTNIDWESFSHIEHRIDSSSCHIYTALWQRQPVIVKLIKADRVNSAISLSEFDAEAAVLQCIQHPNVIRLLGSGRTPRRFLVLELLDGGSVSHALGLRPDSLDRTRRQKFTYLETLMMARDLASALEHLHSQVSSAVQVIHRDIKPDNIGWTSDGTLKLFDFGLCSLVLSEAGMRAYARNGGAPIPYQKGYRMTGNTGTLRYMAPEVALNQPYHASVDVYSFSIVIWQVLAGQVPFQDMGKRKYMEKVVKGGYRPEMSATWPAPFRRLLMRCWDKDKNKRPNFSEIVQILDVLLQEERRLELSGWRRVRNVLKDMLKALKTLIVRIRPLFLVVFGCFMIGSIRALAQGEVHAGVALAILTAIGLYVTLVSGLRYHLRGEGIPTKRSSMPSGSAGSRDSSSHSDATPGGAQDLDVDDIIGLAVGLETGLKKNKDESAIKFTFNPLEPEDKAPLYGL